MIYNKIFYSKNFYYTILFIIFFIICSFIVFFVKDKYNLKNRLNNSIALYQALNSQSKDEKISELSAIIKAKIEPYCNIASLKLVQILQQEDSKTFKIENLINAVQKSSFEPLKNLANLKLSIINRDFHEEDKIYYFSNKFLNALSVIEAKPIKSKEILENISAAIDSNYYIKELAKETLLAYNL